jgi:light-regulated signal transduction histidine kinase (bacteriophytochrome)
MILIVDDKHENLFSLKSLLQLYAYEVDTASSGEEALKKILKNEYAVLILDVQMPGMNGFEVAEAVTGLNKTKDIPIIFLSAVNIDKRFITKGYQSGGVDYITKPFDNDLLLLKVKSFYRLYEHRRDLKLFQEKLKEEIEMRKRSQQEVERINQLLEQKVEERTKDLVRSNKDLADRNAELAQYAYLASHDLQEPLRKILIFSKIINEKYLSGMPEAREQMAKVIASSERMRNLINDFLSYSKLSGASQFSQVDLNQIIKETLADLELMIEEKETKIEFENLPTIEAVPSQVRQVFQNLLTNAMKFARKDSKPAIKIWSERVSEKTLGAPADENGAYVRIYIRDNGIGMDQSYFDKIFIIFQRLHGMGEYEGTGIGLAIVKKIVDRHHGLVGVDSKEGEGATFILLLPVKQEENTLPDQISL